MLQQLDPVRGPRAVRGDHSVIHEPDLSTIERDRVGVVTSHAQGFRLLDGVAGEGSVTLRLVLSGMPVPGACGAKDSRRCLVTSTTQSRSSRLMGRTPSAGVTGPASHQGDGTRRRSLL
jgi:hypothetical protein